MRRLLTMAGIMHNRVGGSEREVKGDLISILAYYDQYFAYPVYCMRRDMELATC